MLSAGSRAPHARVAAWVHPCVCAPEVRAHQRVDAISTGRSHIHCRWVSEAEVLAEHQGLARIRRWQKVWAGLQEEFQYDAVKGAEWEPYPPEYEQVERVIATRCFAPGEVEYLVKWRMLT
jgi:hypothetical protein